MRRLLFFIAFFHCALAFAKIDRLLEVDKDVWRGSQPRTQADYDQLREMGIKTIINLRWDESVPDSKEKAQENGIKFVNIPIIAKERPKDKDIEKIFKTLLDKKNQPIFLHCTYGKDRTGLIFALYRVHQQGWSVDKAYKEWVKFGFSEGFLKNLKIFFNDNADRATATITKKIQFGGRQAKCEKTYN